MIIGVNAKKIFPETLEALQRDTYVNDVQYIGNTKVNLKRFKAEVNEIMKNAEFNLQSCSKMKHTSTT